MLENERWQWGILQQKKNGLDLLDAQLTERMNRFRGQADMWVFPPKIAMYLTIVPAEKTDYYLAGPAGPGRLADGPEGFTSFKGSRVFLTRTFEVDSRGPMNYMSSPYQIGEHYVMEDRNKYHNYKAYQSSDRDIQVYDEDTNVWHAITLEWALDNCQLFDADGALRPIDRTKFRDTFAKDNKEMAMFTHHVDSNGQVQPVQYFGQINDKNTDARDIYNLAQTALNGMGELGDSKTVAAVWKRGVELIEQMESIEYDAATEAYLQALRAANGGGSNLEVSQANPKCPTIVDLEEWVPQPHGTLALPARDSAWPFTVPPFMQSAAGFRAMADAHQRGGVGAWNVEAFQAADDFSRLVSALVQSLRRIFPNNLVTDASFASSWWHRPKAEDTLFENLIVNHRPPAWLATGTVGTTATPAEDAGAQGSALTDISKSSASYISQNITGLPADLQSRVDNLVTNYRPVFSSVTDIRDNTKLEQELRRAYVLKTITMVDTRGEGTTERSVRKLMNELAPILNTNENQSFAAIGGLFDTAKFAKSMSETSGILKPTKGRILRAYAQLEREFATVRASLTPENVDRFVGTIPDIDVAGYRRAPLVFSPKMMSTLSQYITETQRSPLAMPSDLNSLDSVVTPSALYQYTNALRTGSGDKMHPYMQTYTANRMELSVETTALVMNARNYYEALQAAQSDTSSTVDLDDGMAEFDSAMNPSSFRRSKRSRPIGAHIDGKPHRRTGHGISTAVSDCVELAGELVTPNFSELFTKLGQEQPHGLLRVVAQAYMFTPFHERALRSFVNNNVLFPMSFVVSRPHARYSALTGIKAKAGAGTTYIGPSSFMVGDDAAIGVHLGTYNYYSASIVQRNENVYVAKAIYIDAYLGGMGVGLYEPDSYQPRQGNYGDGSVFVIAMPYNERAHHQNNQLPNPMSLTGNFEHLPIASFEVIDKSGLHYSTAYYYNKMWGWSSMGAREEIEESRHYSQDAAPPNYVTYRGHTWYRGVDGQFSVVSVGTGHWGPDATYIGCGEVRNGQLDIFTPQNYGALQQA